MTWISTFVSAVAGVSDLDRTTLRPRGRTGAMVNVMASCGAGAAARCSSSAAVSAPRPSAVSGRGPARGLPSGGLPARGVHAKLATYTAPPMSLAPRHVAADAGGAASAPAAVKFSASAGAGRGAFPLIISHRSSGDIAAAPCMANPRASFPLMISASARRDRRRPPLSRAVARPWAVACIRVPGAPAYSRTRSVITSCSAAGDPEEDPHAQDVPGAPAPEAGTGTTAEGESSSAGAKRGWDIPWPWGVWKTFGVALLWFAGRQVVCSAFLVSWQMVALNRGLDLLTLYNRIHAELDVVYKLIEIGVGLVVLHCFLKPWYPLQEHGLFRYTPSREAIGAGVAAWLFQYAIAIGFEAIRGTVWAMNHYRMAMGGVFAPLKFLFSVLYGFGRLSLIAAQWLRMRVPEAAASMLHSPRQLALNLLLNVLLGPVWEETIFRGFLFASLTKSIPFWAANTLSTLAFVAFHGEGRVEGNAALALMGFNYAWVYARTRSLASPIVAHMLQNLFATLLTQ